MKKSWMWMLLWFVFNTNDPGQVSKFLTQLGPAAQSAKVTATSWKGLDQYYVFYEAPAQIKLGN